MSDQRLELELSGCGRPLPCPLQLPNDADFVVQHGFDLEVAPTCNSTRCDCLASHEEARAFAAHAGRQLDSNLQRTDGNQFIDWLTRGAGAGEIDQMQD